MDMRSQVALSCLDAGIYEHFSGTDTRRLYFDIKLSAAYESSVFMNFLISHYFSDLIFN